MAQFSIKDLADLARAGYTPATVKELLTLEKVEPDKAEEPPAGTGADDEPKPAAEDPKGESEKGQEPGTAGESERIKELENRLQDAEQKLKAAQEANNRRDASGDAPDPEKGLLDIFASYQ